MPRKKDELLELLIDAVAKRNLEGMRKCLERGANVNARYQGDSTVLMLASGMGHEDEFIDLLLSYGADVNLTDKDGDSCVMSACWQGYNSNVSYLIQHGANVNVQNKRGLTALMYSAVSCSLCIKVLADAGADLYLSDKKGLTPLDYAYKSKYHAAAVELLRVGFDVQQAQFSTSRQSKSAIRWITQIAPMLFAAETNDYDLMKHHLSQGAPTDARNGDDGKQPLLVTAAQYGYRDIVTLLLDHGADINITNRPGGRTAFNMAQFYARYDVVELLRERGAKD